MITVQQTGCILSVLLVAFTTHAQLTNERDLIGIKHLMEVSKLPCDASLCCTQPTFSSCQPKVNSLSALVLTSGWLGETYVPGQSNHQPHMEVLSWAPRVFLYHGFLTHGTYLLSSWALGGRCTCWAQERGA